MKIEKEVGEMEADGSVNAADEFNFDKYDEECKYGNILQ